MEIKGVENLAELARIELSENEKKTLLADMESILGYVRQVEAVEVGDTEQAYNLSNVWRGDVLEPREFDKASIREQFPASQDGFLKVKKFL